MRLPGTNILIRQYRINNIPIGVAIINSSKRINVTALVMSISMHHIGVNAYLSDRQSNSHPVPWLRSLARRLVAASRRSDFEPGTYRPKVGAR